MYAVTEWIMDFILWKDLLPDNISSYIELNRGADKNQVAIEKIMLHHPHFDMEPFFEWDLKVLPFVVNWLHRARDIDQKNEWDIDAPKLSFIY